MLWGLGRYSFTGCLFILLTASFSFLWAQSDAPWHGVMTDSGGDPVSAATVTLHSAEARDYTADATNGKFDFAAIPSGTYQLSVTVAGKEWKSNTPIIVKDATPIAFSLQLTTAGQIVLVQSGTQKDLTAPAPSGQAASGGEHLSSNEVSSLPLNARDFSKLLLLAAGTMTDTNGAANFTQQFAVNGQRGVTTVFATDGFETTDPEMGGATFSNFNVDAIQEVQANSGVMMAETGHGAASYTNVVTKSGTNQIHGSVFEFLRNASLDARNYFDYRDPSGRHRIPPFARNEFGFTNGGPIVLPGIYDGRGKTFYFGEYQGFRQVLGTTQVIPVPTAQERQGIDTTTFPGDTLTVPVNPDIASVLNGYPLPNESGGAFGERTYAASSKVVTRTDQFSIRVDHTLSSKASLFTRFSLNQVNGPLTNPDQTIIDPTFGVQFFDHQRNAGVHYTRAISSHLTSDTSISYIRSTPFFPSPNHTQPGIEYGDGLYQSFNTPAGSIFGSYSNLYQFKQDFSWVRGQHGFKWGVEIRANRDSTIFGVNPNGNVRIRWRHSVFASQDSFCQRYARHSYRRSAAGFVDRTADCHALLVWRHFGGEHYSNGRQVRRSGCAARSVRLLFSGCMESHEKPYRQLRAALRSEQPHPRSHEADLRHIFLRSRWQAYRIRRPQRDAEISRQSAASLRSGLERLGAAAGRRLRAGPATPCCTRAARSRRYCRILWQDNFLTAAIPFVYPPMQRRCPGLRCLSRMRTRR